MNQEALEDLRELISAALPNEISEIVIAFGEITVLARAERIVEVLTFLKNDSSCKFTQLTDLCGADYPERAKRFDVVYQLLSVTQNQRLRVKIQTDEETPVPSVVEVHPAAGWYERETWDMYGVMFDGNPDLRRILTDYGFQGFPLRKDFPLTGYVELRYSEEEKRVVYEPVQLTQEFRKFDFMSPWEGAKYILPGDEKAESGQEGK